MTEGKQILTMFSSADEAIVVGEGKSKSQDLCNIISPTQKGLEGAIFATDDEFLCRNFEVKIWASAKRLARCSMNHTIKEIPSTPVIARRRTQSQCEESWSHDHATTWHYGCQPCAHRSMS